MAITTMAEFAAAITGMTITGVKTAGAFPPNQVETAMLPYSYPARLEIRQEGGMTIDGRGGWPVLTCEFVIIVEAVGQNKQSANWTLAVTLMDALATALRATDMARSKSQWSMRTDKLFTGNGEHWCIVCNVEANG